MSTYRRGWIRIDACEVLEQVEDDELIEEVRSRKLHVSELGQMEHFDRDYAVRAYEELIGGRIENAIVMLERALFPTIVTESEYRKAMRS